MLETTLPEIDRLLETFSKIPKPVKQPTYLSICQYPQSRFEEVCTRILSFYFHPKNDHGFQYLFISSLLECMPHEQIQPGYEEIEVRTEVFTQKGNRLDILILGDSFSIGIENKIFASVYNDLEDYKNLITFQGKKQSIGIVLSLKDFDSTSLNNINKNGFFPIKYSVFLEVLKTKLGKHLSQANQKYLTFLNDFMETLETMNGGSSLNEKMTSYFFDNKDRIETLINLYKKYNDEAEAAQTKRIYDLKDKISALTQTDRWWAWEDWDLGYNDFQSGKPKIGIEAWFHLTKNNPLGEFRIMITTWDLQSWAFYEEQIMKDFPFPKKLEKSPANNKNRVVFHLDVIYNNDEEQILSTLKKYYDYLFALTRE